MTICMSSRSIARQKSDRIWQIWFRRCQVFTAAYEQQLVSASDSENTVNPWSGNSLIAVGQWSEGVLFQDGDI